ncbi:uncharacterized protein LOC144612335 [Rhinoraja longicauda]
MWRPGLILPLLLWPLASVIQGYSFRNCVETHGRGGSFQCVHRFLTRVSGAVSDLPVRALHLNVSYNRIRSLGPGAFCRLPRLQTLRLDCNRIQEIGPGAFDNLTSLQTLNLSYNRISRLGPSDFLGLASLVRLLLHHNQVASLDPGSLGPLRNLQYLLLNSNQLSNFSQLAGSVSELGRLGLLELSHNRLGSLGRSPSLPPSLRYLYLANNSLASLDARPGLLGRVASLDLSHNQLADAADFSRPDLRSVQRLAVGGNPLNVSAFLRSARLDLRAVDYSGLGLRGRQALSDLCSHLGRGTVPRLWLRGNQIARLEPGYLAGCPPILEWDLSSNHLTSVGCLEFDGRRASQSFTVEHNRIKSLQSCSRAAIFPNLTLLSYRYNRIFTIEAQAFAHAPGLRSLMLNINNVAVVKKGAFSGLPSLRLLRLDNNLITDVYFDTFGGLPSLRQLNLRDNRISVIFGGVFSGLTELDILDLGGNKIHRLSAASFRGLARLSKLYLDRNSIGRLDGGVFGPLPGLGVLDLARNWIRYDSTVVAASPFRRLGRLRHLKLQAQQPYGINIVPPGFFDGLLGLETLYIGGNKMSLASDVFKDLANLTGLSMSDACNGIHSLGPGVFRNLQNLAWLDLENTGLRSMSLDMVGNLTRLRVLMLGKNAIQEVNRTILQHLPALGYLDVRKNPFTCTCRNTWFFNWSLGNPRAQVAYFYNHTCAGRPGDYLYRFDARVCYQDLGKLVFQATFPLILALTLCPIAYVHAYWHLKYGFYILRSWLSDLREREDQARAYKFDAFVSYTSGDEGWVLAELVPALEADGGPGSLRLCLHHRDFQPGRYIVDNIVDSIYQSRKTICVVSRGYLASEWCSMELQMASYRLFHELKDVLVLVFLEHIPEAELSAYHRMRKVVKKKTYLRWPADSEAQSLFWAKVRGAVKGSSAPQETGPSLGL